MVATLLLGGIGVAVAGSSTPGPRDDAAVAKAVRHEIVMYPYYGVWDNIEFQVAGGNVTLSGEVTQPYKKTDIARAVQRVQGVTSLSNNLEVLPLSSMDNQLRRQVARAIYSDPTLSRYAIAAQPAIHVIVDNGHVTLEGIVANDFDKQVAGLRASSSGLSFGPVVNNLRVEKPSPKKG
jgi:hyperosmotically inducible protein